jgi:hypothetical protein
MVLQSSITVVIRLNLKLLQTGELVLFLQKVVRKTLFTLHTLPVVAMEELMHKPWYLNA